MQKYMIYTIIILILLMGCNKTEYTQSSTAKSNNINEAAPGENKTTNKDKPLVTFIELGSVNCIPCKMMQPVMKQVEEKYKKQVQVVFYDVWTKTDAPRAQEYKIRVIPTQVFLDNKGIEYYRHEGFFAFEELEKILKQKGVK